MKKFYIFSISCLLVVATLLSVQLKPNIANAEIQQFAIEAESFVFDDDFSISVMGESKKCITPDMAKIVASIETLDIDMSKAKEQNFKIFAKVLNSLEKMGIAKDKIILDSFSAYPNYDYNAGRTLTGYIATTMFSIDVDNLDVLKNIIDTMTENGITRVNNINYQVSNVEVLYEEVLFEALENAKNKAIKLTQRKDLKLINIKEETVYSSSNLFKTYCESLENEALIGQIEIRAKVTVDFV